MNDAPWKASDVLLRVVRAKFIGPLIVLLLVAGVMTATSPRFFTAQNLVNVSLQMTIVSVVAVGATMVIMTAQIDLSSGSLLALISVLTAGLIKEMNQPVVIAVLVMLALGAFLGLVNGFFASYGRIPPFIFTLGTLSVFRGLAHLYTGGTPIFSVSDTLNQVFYSQFLGIPMPFVYVLVIYTVAAIYLRWTKGGRQIFAVGGNPAAARLSGINVNWVRTKAFMFAGILGAIGGILMTARLDTGSPSYGQGMELLAIAAAVIGGASLFGGHGSVIGTLFGAMTIVIIQNGLNLHGVASAWQQIALGGIIAAAVGADMWRRDAAGFLRRLFGLEPRDGDDPTDTPGGTSSSDDYAVASDGSTRPDGG